MSKYKEDFEQLHFTECTIDSVSIADDRVEIQIGKGLIFLAGHPAFREFGSECPAATLVFSSVRKYTAKSIPYIGPPSEGKFGTPQVDFREFSGKAFDSPSYYLETLQPTALIMPAGLGKSRSGELLTARASGGRLQTFIRTIQPKVHPRHELSRPVRTRSLNCFFQPEHQPFTPVRTATRQTMFRRLPGMRAAATP